MPVATVEDSTCTRYDECGARAQAIRVLASSPTCNLASSAAFFLPCLAPALGPTLAYWQYMDTAYQAANAEGHSIYVGVHELCHLTSKTPCEVGAVGVQSTRVLWHPRVLGM